MRTVLAIAVAGALGTVARYAVEGIVTERTTDAFPVGTLVVNISGAFVLGFFFTLLTDRLIVAAWLRSAVTIGFLGAYTTFSTLTLETLRLAEDGAPLLALLNGLGSLLVGFVAVYAGVVLARTV